MEGNHGISLSEKGNRDVAETEKILSDIFLSGSFEPTITFEEHVGPLSIHDTGTSRGRGLIVEENVRCGQILIISNSIASVTKDWPKVNQMNKEVLGELASDLVTWSSDSKIKCDQVYELDYCRDSPSDIHVPPISLYAREITECDENSNPGKQQDYQHIKRVVFNNAIQYGTKIRNPQSLSDFSWILPKFMTWGIWLVPSFINHSCIPNCNYMVIGKTMIVRAAVDMSKGEELTLPYFSIFDSLRRRKLKARRRKFECVLTPCGQLCDCQRCIFEDSARETFLDIEKGMEEIGRQVQKFNKMSATVGVKNRPALGESLEIHPILFRLLEKQSQYVPLIERAVKKFSAQKKINPTDVSLKWLKASYMSAYKAKHVERKYRYSNSTTYQNGESITAILNLDDIYPGNHSGRHYFSILLVQIKRRKTSEYYRNKEEQAKKFYTAFYGQQQKEVFRTLLARDRKDKHMWSLI